ncbi:MAG: amino acid adenylation domain-containing protein, partial [Bacteroidota bacterium]
MEELLTKLAAQGISLNVEGEGLAIYDPNKALSEELLAEIKEHKSILIKLLNEAGIDQFSNKSIPQAEEAESYPLSAAQRRLYFLHQFEPDSLAYNMPSIVELEGNLDIDRLHNAFVKLIKRHDLLRTYFSEENGTPVQKISVDAFFEIRSIDVNNTTTCQELVTEFIRPFDLSNEPGFEVGLIMINPFHHMLLVNMHHIITDGVSHNVLISEFMTLYNDDSLQDLRLQYKDYAVWQNDESNNDFGQQKDFWIKEYQERPEHLDLPYDFPRPAVVDNKGKNIKFEIDEADTSELKALADQEGTTLFMVVFAMFNVLISKLGNQNDLIIGVPTAGRHHSDVEDMIGMFVNTLPIRNDVNSSQTFKDLLLSITSKTLKCFDNEAYQYEDLIDELKIARNTSRNPLFDVLFTYENYENKTLNIPGLKVTPQAPELGVAQFDIDLGVIEADDKLCFNLAYFTSLFKEETIQRFVAYFQHIKRTILDEPTILISELEILPAKEKDQLLIDFNNTTVAYPKNDSFVDLFESMVDQYPDKIAVIHNNHQLTYFELNGYANRIAHYLESRGIIKGQLVPLLLNRSIDLLAWMIGIQKAGGAFVAIDVRNPKTRILKILNDCSPFLVPIDLQHLNLLTNEELISFRSVVLCDEQDVEEHFREFQSTNIDSKVIVDDLAYIVYTSGSTGQPKGVMIHHGGLINHLRGLSDKLELDQNDTFAQTAECSFDVYVLQFLLTLIKGGSTRIIDREQVLDIDSLAQIVNNEAITIMELVPSLIRPLLQSDIDLDRTSNQLRWLITTGEPISYELVQDWYNRYPTKPLVNAYGPAEVSDDVTLYIIPNACSDIQNKVPVGKPLANLKVYVLNTDLDLCPIGVTGELYISGIGVGQGYWNDKEKTAEKFIENPFVSALSSTNHDVLYKTGDIGYWTPDGNIVVVGRVDNMVKIRGARIEIGEIEEALGAHEEIMECAVVVKGEEGQEYLVGYYQSENEIANLDLKQHLSVRLPDYMIPPSYMHLEEMPRTLNGKLDRNALSDQDVTLDELYIPAFTNEQKLLVKIWSDVLGVKQLGITHNFFQVGGDSIKSIQISSRMRAEGYNLTVKDIFTYQTIEELSQHLVRLTNQCDQSTITGGIPLSPIQKRYFEDVKVARHHYNQSMMLHFKNGISVEMVSAIFEKIQLHHDALRVVFKETDGQFIQENNGIDMSVSVYEEDLSGQIEFDAKLLQCCNALQRSINIEEGPLVKLGLFHNSDGSRLLIVIHHLVVDGVSWRIILEDIATLYDQAQNYDPLTLPLKTDSFQKWSRQLSNYIDTDDFEKGKQYWNRLAQMNTPMIPMDNEEGESSVRNTKQRSFKLDAQYTDRLLKDIHKPFNTNVNDILVTALMLSINDQYGFNEIKVDLEGHGRNTLGESIDITRTVGWFTSIFPVLLSCDSDDLIKTIKSVKEAIHNVPNDGFDHLVNNYLNDNATKEKRSGIVFNYLGQFDNSLNNDEVKLSSHPRGMEIAPNQSVEYPLDISAAVYNGQLELAIDYCNTQFNDSTIQSLLDAFHQELIEVIAFCSDFKDMVLTPSDLTFRGLTIDELDHLQSSYKIEDVYPLTPLQEGLLFHSLLNDEGSQYFEQMNCKWTGNLDVKAAEQSFNSLISRYDVLRTIFLHKGYDQPLQLVLNDRHVPFKFRDVSAECLKGSRKAVVEKYCAVDRSNKFDLSQDVLMRLTILKTSDNEYEFIWSHHHILMDGWCVSIIFGDFMSFYQNQVNGLNIYLPKVQPYAKYLRWLEKFDKRGSEIYWQNLLSEFDVQTSFPKKSQTTNDQYELETQTVSLTGRKYQALKHFVSNNGITLNTIVKSAWGLLLSKYNDVKDVVFGAVVSGRPSAVDNVESIVGLFINTIPVRVRLNRDHDFLALAKQVQTETIESEPYHYHALTEIQNLSDIEAELFDHILVFENYPIDQNIANQADADHIISDVNIFEQDSYDLSITIMESNQLKIEFNYNSLVYDSETINSIATHFKNILEQAIELPSQEIGKIDML